MGNMSWINVWLSGLLFLLIQAAAPAFASPAPPSLPPEDVGEWQNEATIPLPGKTTRFDYESLDPETGRLFIAHTGDGTLAVVDAVGRKVIANLSGFPEVRGVLAIPALQRVYATVSPSPGKIGGILVVVDIRTLKTIGTIPVGVHPDGLDYEAQTGRIFVSNEWGKSLSVVDAKTEKVIATIPLRGVAGNPRTDSVTHRIYVTVQTRNLLVRVDPYSLHVVRRYRLPCRRPHGLWIEGPSSLAYVACEGDHRLLVVDLLSGKIRSSLPTGRRPDILSFDFSRGLLFVASESGFVDVYRKTGKELVPISTKSFLGFRAHSILVDPSTHLLFLPLENDEGHAVLRILSWKDVRTEK